MTASAPPSQPYSPGLEGVIAGETAICHVDPSGILLYRGYDIHSLANKATFEQIIGLLIHGQMPDAAETSRLRKELAESAALPAPVIDALRLIPPNAHPMDALRTGVSMLAAFDPELDDNSHAANVRKSIRL